MSRQFVNIEDLKSIIQAEIKWHEDVNNDEESSDISGDYKEGFIAGLNQAMYVLKRISEVE